ncbi:hypothetical protein CANTEDRAFT_106399 [Yamadazyma tenuis ATCC 10573]|uniref:Cytochrome b5 heme-binding domain-containing protein n=1 Tax=Candida tenuis (strain ATCC 10573 / BCRC 21748 / CBS 615 / JCM 9827 / NBRC 10315 / NRRL Y-1498 / VKM Y-70) TaxID=590646 RepID=G3B5P1_CANTC|nr:uncharacterized protein CANTEDRAFT_106399 [Yamadazyma tenuis ATCC 10573]EGV63276.1 hypothetical protein CANTEDRAFT_106399 [Yamadazyma tenuis ATCC 10573]
MGSNTLFPGPNSFQRVDRSDSLAPNSTAINARQRQKVVLEPGHSPLDWANLNSNSSQRYKLRGVPPNTPPPQYVTVTKDELKLHNRKDDAWTSINGKVFNITSYIDFHPGGVKQIMKCAGRDGTQLFNKYHAWVSADRMLSNCMVGMYVN